MQLLQQNRALLARLSAAVFVLVLFWYLIVISNLSVTFRPLPSLVDPPAPPPLCAKIERLNETQVKMGESVFFIVSAKVEDEYTVPINARQACGIESAALYHPEKDIYVMIVTPEDITSMSPTDCAILSPLLQYPNIKLRILPAQSFLLKTPAGVLLPKLAKSQFPVEHTSDILRYVILYKFGGLYLDTDVILMKRMPEYNNYIGVESNRYCGAGIFHFAMDRVGREMANATVAELVKVYNPNAYSTSGPVVVTHVLYKRCNKTHDADLLDKLAETKICDGYVITPRPVFYGISFGDYKKFFQKGFTPEIKSKLGNTTTLHYWNHMTFMMAANQPGIPFYDIAFTQCPRVHYNSNHLF